MLVKPKAGLVVRDPATMRELPAEGIVVADNDLYWARIVRDGDVTSEPDDVTYQLRDEHGAPVDAPVGDLAADLASPGTLVTDQPLAGTGEAIQMPGAVDAAGEPVPPVTTNSSQEAGQ